MCAHTARFAYNWALEWLFDYYHSHHHVLCDGELRKIFTSFKKLPENQWVYTVSNNIPKQAIKDACADFANFIFNNTKKPLFKKRSLTTPSFYQDGEKLFFTTTHVKLEKIGTKENHTFHQNFVVLAEPHRIPINAKYSNCRIHFDGIRWWLTLTVKFSTSLILQTVSEYTTCSEISTISNTMPRDSSCNNLSKHTHLQADTIPSSQCVSAQTGLGIDLGLLHYATLSDGTLYLNINKSRNICRLEKKKRRLRRSLQRKYKNAFLPLYYYHFDRYTLAPSYIPNTHVNIIKTEREILEIQNRLHNIRINHINHIIKDIISKKPPYIVIEDLPIKKIMEDDKLYFSVKNQYFHYFKKHLKEKCEKENIVLIIANRYFPSTQKCCICGKINPLSNLSTRLYVCSCGNKIDRDLQAAINLKNYIYEYANSEFKPTDYKYS